jgi:hypothetical protein
MSNFWILWLFQIHVMPRDVFGLDISIFGVSQQLLKVLPTWLVDKVLVLLSWLTLGSTAKYNLVRPAEGPLTLKARTGRTPVLDVGTMGKIKSGEIKVREVWSPLAFAVTSVQFNDFSKLHKLHCLIGNSGICERLHAGDASD